MLFMSANASCGFLDDQSKQRLERIAPLFDIAFERISPDRYRITVQDGGAARSCEVAAAVAHMRLLTELCEKTVNWVYFREAEHCAKTFLSLPDGKIQRISQLYRIRMQATAGAQRAC